MSEFRFAVEVLAPAERIGAVWMDVELWPEWNPVVTRAESLGGGPLTVGSRTRIVQPGLMPAVWRVTELNEPGWRFTWAMHKPGIAVTAIHLIDGIGVGGIGDRCRVTLLLKYSGLLGTFLAWQFKNLNWDYLTREACGLKLHCERAAVSDAAIPFDPSQRNC
jgi:Polyketide cyclase / dehydrase and lipid transport